MSVSELRVYDRTGVTLNAVLDKATGVQWRHPLAGDGPSAGSLTFSLLASDAKASSVVRDAIVKVRWAGAERVPFRIANIARVLQDGGWRLDVTAVQGRCLLGDAVALPEYGLRVGSGETRRFGFMSVQGTWYVSSEWHAPNGILLSSYSRWPAYPVGYPDKSSYWLSSPTQPAVGGKTWYRAEFTTSATYPAVRLFVVTDDAADVYLDGELVLQIPGGPNAWRQTSTVDVVLPTGSHVLAVELRDEYEPSSEVLRGELLCCLASMNQTTADTGDTVASVIFHSAPTSQWKVRYDSTEPGWRRAQVVKQLFTEASARGVRGPSMLTLDFTDTQDTAAASWDDRGDFEVSTFGDKLDRITESLFDPSLDWDVSPAMKVQAWKRRGSNKTSGSSAVALQVGKDLTSATITDTFDVTTSLYGRTAEGLMVHQADSTAATDAGGLVEGGMMLGSIASSTTADGVVTAHLASLGYFGREVSLGQASNGPVPYLDYGLGDTVLAPNGSGGWLAVRVLAFTYDGSTDTPVVLPEVAWDRTVTL